MKKILSLIVLLFGMTFGAFASDQTTAVDANAQAGAQAISVGGSGGQLNFSPSTTNNSTAPIYMPNGTASVLPNPATFIKGIGLAEKTNQHSKLFGDFCKASIPAEILRKRDPRAQPVSRESDYGNMVWQPYRDYFVKIPSEENAVANFMAEITNVSQDFGRMSPETTHYCLGHVAIRTLFDEETQDVTLQETLINEALTLAADTITGFANVTPVVLYETNAYYDGTAVSGSGVSVTPQVSGIPAVGVATGSLFSWGKNHGLASSSHGLGMKIIFLAQAPNPTEGHPIAAQVQKLVAEAQRKAEQARVEAQKPAVQPPVVVETPTVKKVVKPHVKKLTAKKPCKK